MQADLLVLTASAWQGVGGRGETQGRERFVSSLSQAGCLFPELSLRKGAESRLLPLTKFLLHGPFQLYPGLKGCCQDERHGAVMN